MFRHGYRKFFLTKLPCLLIFNMSKTDCFMKSGLRMFEAIRKSFLFFLPTFCAAWVIGRLCVFSALTGCSFRILFKSESYKHFLKKLIKFPPIIHFTSSLLIPLCKSAALSSGTWLWFKRQSYFFSGFFPLSAAFAKS